MTIMRTIGRLLLQESSASSPPRWLCTAAEKAAPGPKQRRKTVIFHKVAKANSKSTVPDILDKWVSEGKEVRRYDITDLSNYFRKHKKFQAALQLYDWMQSSKLELTDADHAIRIDLLCKTGGVASAEKYFNSLQVSDKTRKTYGALLGCYCKERVLDKALEIFEEMKVSNYMSTLNYNNLASLYYSMEQPAKVVSLVQEMEENNIAPDIYTYNLLINSYAAMKNLDAIDEVLEKMKSNNMDCNLFTYGNMATIYCNSGLHEKANAFLGLMENMKMQPDDDVFEACRTRIKLYSEMNNRSGVNRTWEALKSAFPTPNNTSYLFMLLALSKLGDQENLEKLFKEWEEGCSSYDYRLPNVLLEYYINRNMIEEASSLYDSLANRGDEPNLRTLNLFAALCVKTSQIDLALKYLETGLSKAKPGKRKWFPTDETIKFFLNYFQGNNDADRAEKFIQIMKKTNRVDTNSLLSNIKASDSGI
ncbi:pentatricopeptide repeat-containing protein At1g02370, mitochondrial-like [Sesamum indicum]|uniref:Pentatricopeptide repeat-containing protein At1g02370, mitochondrial-like n=1 Tax=Sesamum indicum TaxID=4182 RepID=A0A6I9TXU6_SESIN|nr:pentatricopeptide repeat-containing protein At1g02370, mitochondrial-like [Sesamum indicum]